MQKFASGAEIICRQYEKCKHQKSYRIEIKPVNLSKRIVLKEASAASHVLVFMIADDDDALKVSN